MNAEHGGLVEYKGNKSVEVFIGRRLPRCGVRLEELYFIS